MKLKSKTYRKQLIYSESLQKIPLWADFSKTAPPAILKISVLETGDCPQLKIIIKLGPFFRGGVKMYAGDPTKFRLLHKISSDILKMAKAVDRLIECAEFSFPSFNREQMLEQHSGK